MREPEAAGHGRVTGSLKRCHLRDLHLIACQDFLLIVFSNKYSYHNHYQRLVVDIKVSVLAGSPMYFVSIMKISVLEDGF